MSFACTALNEFLSYAYILRGGQLPTYNIIFTKITRYTVLDKFLVVDVTTHEYLSL